jgi:hypothetical protein
VTHQQGEVAYDFTAAEDLSWALTYLSNRLRELAALRSRLRSKDLDCPDAPPVTVPWRGSHWHDFRSHFDTEQAALAGFAEDAMRLKARVDAATEAARRARSGKH